MSNGWTSSLRADARSGSVTRTVIVLALPILLTAVMQGTVGLVKLYWVGRFGAVAIAAVAVSETIAFLLFPLLIGIATGTAAIVARAAGAEDRDAAALTAVQSLLIAVLLGGVASAAGRAASSPLLSLLGAEPAVVRAGHHYLEILLLGVIPLFVLFVAVSTLNATGHTIESMLASLAVSATTLALAPCLMFGLALFPKLGIDGAAWAAVLGDVIGAAVCLRLLFAHRDVFCFRADQWRPHLAAMRDIMSIGAAGFAQLLLRMLAGAAMMRIIAASGTGAVVAYGIAIRLDSVILTPSFALGGAAATMVGINLGSMNPERARAASWSAALANLAIVVPLIAVVVAFAPYIVRYFNGDADVVRLASAYLHVVWPTHIFTALCITLGRAMQGAGDTMSSMFVTIAGMWLLQVPASAAVAATWPAPVTAVWWIVAIAAVVQGTFMAVWFETGRWKRKTFELRRVSA